MALAAGLSGLAAELRSLDVSDRSVVNLSVLVLAAICCDSGSPTGAEVVVLIAAAVVVVAVRGDDAPFEAAADLVTSFASFSAVPFLDSFKGPFLVDAVAVCEFVLPVSVPAT